MAEWKSRLRGWGYEPVICSVDTKKGLDTLQFILRDQTSVIVGPSGVGKSSLINALRDNKTVIGTVEDANWFEHVGSLFFIYRQPFTHSHKSISANFWTDLSPPLKKLFQMLGRKYFEEQRVGEVSARSGKGKHTTRHVSLLPLSEGGYLADTPGFSQPSLMKVTKKSLAQYFPEVSAIDASSSILVL